MGAADDVGLQVGWSYGILSSKLWTKSRLIAGPAYVGQSGGVRRSRFLTACARGRSLSKINLWLTLEDVKCNMTLWIDRLGIMLDFLAGFMLAPELFGEERLRAWEKAIETWLQGITWSLQGRSNRYRAIADDMRPLIDAYRNPDAYGSTEEFGNRWPPERLDHIRKAIEPSAPSGCAGLILLLALGAITWLILLIWQVPRMFRRAHSQVPKPEMSSSRWVRWFLMVFAFGVFGMLMLKLGIMLFRATLSENLSALFEGLSHPFIAALQRLSGDDELRRVLVIIGIIFFVLGFIAQFIATF